MAAKNAEVVTANEFPEIQKYDRNATDFSGLVEQADEVFGNELLKDDTLDRLEGVPFLITHVTFRPSFPDSFGDGVWGAYVSCEAVVADLEYLLATGKVQREERTNAQLVGYYLMKTGFRPGEHVVFNDGSTGICRQIVAYLETKNYIVLDHTLPEEGVMGASRFDAPPSHWADIHYGESRFADGKNGPDGFMFYDAEIRLLCPRGTRASDYEWEGKDAKTRYIA